jgi:hypothetical protein
MPDTTGFIYTLRTVSVSAPPMDTEAPPGEAISIDADRFGNVLFKAEPVEVPTDKFEHGLSRCLAVAKTVIAKAADLSSTFHVESITLKLALDAGVGVVFVGDAKIEAGIEVEIKRIGGLDHPETGAKA